MVPRWIRSPSLVVCFISGLLSLVRAADGILQGTIPAATLFWQWVWIAFLVSAAAVIVEDWWDRRALTSEIEKLKVDPVELKISPLELRRVERPNTGGQEVFLRAKIELLRPVEVQVEQYSMELSLHGFLENPRFVDDAVRWQTDDNSRTPPHSEPLRPLPMQLRSGHPVEGWVHFTSGRNGYEVAHSTVRLFVHTSRGDGSLEIKAENTNWNPVGPISVLPVESA